MPIEHEINLKMAFREMNWIHDMPLNSLRGPWLNATLLGLLCPSERKIVKKRFLASSLQCNYSPDYQEDLFTLKYKKIEL